MGALSWEWGTRIIQFCPVKKTPGPKARLMIDIILQDFRGQRGSCRIPLGSLLLSLLAQDAEEPHGFRSGGDGYRTLGIELQSRVGARDVGG